MNTISVDFANLSDFVSVVDIFHADESPTTYHRIPFIKDQIEKERILVHRELKNGEVHVISALSFYPKKDGVIQIYQLSVVEQNKFLLLGEQLVIVLLAIAQNNYGSKDVIAKAHVNSKYCRRLYTTMGFKLSKVEKLGSLHIAHYGKTIG